jgi:NADPH:quinone reductase-like Zn-dependent oxidoreductase
LEELVMRAVVFREFGQPSVLTVSEVPDPHAGPGEVRIRVRAASVNPIDWKIRAGYMQQFMPLELPAIPGRDAAGVVDEVGDGVVGTAVGDVVFGLSGTGTTAEYAVLTAWAPVPGAWALEQAAGAGVAAETAVRTLNMLGVTSGSKLLIEGAAGGVGSAAVQIALARGAALVIGTAGERNHEFLRSLGATATTYGPGLADRVSALAPDGIDGALDTVGSGSLPELIKIVGHANDVVSIADYSAAEHGARTTHASEAPAEALAEVAALGAAGRFTPVVEATFALDRIAEAHALSQAGHTRGKLVVVL